MKPAFEAGFLFAAAGPAGADIRRGEMTRSQLQALAIYRTHKHCHCDHCQEARKALSDYDRQPRVCGGRSPPPSVPPSA